MTNVSTKIKSNIDDVQLLEQEIYYLQTINRFLLCPVSHGFKKFIDYALNVLTHDLGAELGHWYWCSDPNSEKLTFESQEEWVRRELAENTFEIIKTQSDKVSVNDALSFFNGLENPSPKILSHFMDSKFSRIDIPSLTLFKAAVFIPFKLNGKLNGFVEFYFLKPPTMDSYFIQFIDSLSETLTQQVEIVKQLEHEKQQVFQLAQSTRLSSLGAMAGGIAHEINNPLTIIMGSLKMAIAGLSGNALNDDQREKIIVSLEKAKSHTDRISKIIKGIRAMSRDGSNDQFTKTSVKEIIEDAYNLCEAKVKTNNIQLTIEMEDEDLLFDCRPVQISQILLNLINNSMDAIGDLEDPWIHIQTRTTQDQYIEFIFTDCGRGIPEKIASQLMQPFFTTKGAGRGTGLGLSISQEIVKSHSGTFYLNRDFEYTQFIIRLPLVQNFNTTSS